MAENQYILDKETIAKLIEKALFMRTRAYSPYSGFKVGAALLTDEGRIYGGCNIENASYPITICAERTAMAKAVSEGERRFKAIAIAGGKGKDPEGHSFPCGACRQFMREFCDSDFLIIVAKNREDYRIFTMQEILPSSFGPEHLM